MEEPLTPREFLHRYNLPQLVRIHDAHLHQLHTSRASTAKTRCSVDSMATSSSSDSSFAQKALNNCSDEDLRRTECSEKILDLDQPFLLYKAYSSRQVIAHTLDSNDGCPQVSAFKRVGPALLIPESYTGWFSLVTNRGQTAGYFGTIDEVAKAQVPYFLTRDEITGFLVPKDPLIINNKTVNSKTKYSQSSHEKTKIKGGTVLRFLGVYEDISALVLGLKNKNSLRSKKSTAPFEHGARYAKCISFANGSSGEVVLIAITETGRFYVVCKHPNVLSYNHVYSIHNLLRIAKLPVTVQLVIGPKPRNYVPSNSSDGKSSIERIENEATTFTAVLCLDEIRVRDVILACTLRPQPLLNEPIREKSSLSSSLRRTLRGNRSTSRTEDSPVLLEFDLDSSFTFVRTFVEKNGTLSTRKIPEMVVQRIAFCNSEAEFWRRQIKISHDVTPKPITDSNQSNNQRKSILNEEFQKKFDKTASIGSRTSNISNVSKISKILQKFWNPLKKSSRKADNDCFDETEDTHTEEVSKEKKMNETCNKSQKHSLKSVSPSSIADYHFYETLRKVDEVKLPPKQKLARKQTLDIIFPEFKVDKNGYILSSQKFVKNSKPEE